MRWIVLVCLVGGCATTAPRSPILRADRVRFSLRGEIAIEPNPESASLVPEWPQRFRRQEVEWAENPPFEELTGIHVCPVRTPGPTPATLHETPPRAEVQAEMTEVTDYLMAHREGDAHGTAITRLVIGGNGLPYAVHIASRPADPDVLQLLAEGLCATTFAPFSRERFEVEFPFRF